MGLFFSEALRQYTCAPCLEFKLLVEIGALYGALKAITSDANPGDLTEIRDSVMSLNIAAGRLALEFDHRSEAKRSTHND